MKESELLGDVVTRFVDDVGFGPFQLIVLLLAGGIMFAEGSEMLVMGSITTLLHGHWELSAAIRGLMVSVVFVGFSVGNMLSGKIGDGWGRRRAVLLSYLMIGIFGFATACATGPVMMLALRFLVGAGCGIGFPAVYSMIPEVCSTKWRSSISTLLIGFMPLGELYASTGVLLIDPELDSGAEGCEAGVHFPSRGLIYPTECSWRSLCEFSALPALIFLFLTFFLLHESPHYLICNRKHDELIIVLKAMKKLNRSEADLGPLLDAIRDVENTDTAARAPALEASCEGYSFMGAIRSLFGSRYRRMTVFLCYAHFTKDFSVFGLAYVLPQYFTFLRTMVTGWQLFTVSAFALPAVLVAFLVTRSNFGHVHSMSLAAGITAILSIGMLEGMEDVNAPAAYSVKVFALSYFIFTVVYTAEIFPALFRNTAVGLCTCAGRLGSITAPLLFEISKETSESFDIFLWTLCGTMAVVTLFAPVALRETTGKTKLEEVPCYGTT